MFEVGDIVDVKGRSDLTAYGKITELTDENTAVVHFRLPRENKDTRGGWGGSCDKCGWPGFLSVNGGTGEIVCMKTGCGFGHGFEERDEIIPISKLINISTKRREEQTNKFRKEIKELRDDIKFRLDDAVEDGIVTKDQRDRMLKEQ